MSVETTVHNDVALLHLDMQAKVARLDAAIEAASLPFRSFETWRSRARQEYLNAKGTSHLDDGPHMRGCARDYVIYLPGINPWDNGLNSTRTVVTNEGLFTLWKQFGALVGESGLEWLGRPTGGKLLGFDPYHTQHPDWGGYPVIESPQKNIPTGSGIGGVVLAALTLGALS